MRNLIAGVLAIFWLSTLRADVVLKFSSSSTSFNEITSFGIVEGSSGNSVANRVYRFAEDSNFTSKQGLGSYKVQIGTAGTIAQIGNVNQMLVNPSFNFPPLYTYSSGVGTMNGATFPSGIMPVSGNAVYLGYFGLDALNLGSDSLTVAALNANGLPSGAWFYGDNAPVIVTPPQTATLTINVTPVPEPGTFCLGAFGTFSAVGTWWARRRRLQAASV
jgi:hypothetical protein